MTSIWNNNNKKDISTGVKNIKRIMGEYYEPMYASNFDNLDK